MYHVTTSYNGNNLFVVTTHYQDDKRPALGLELELVLYRHVQSFFQNVKCKLDP